MGIEEIKEKKIFLYGCGRRGKRFYLRYRKKLNICGVIDANVENFYDVPVYKIDDFSKLQEDYFVVITTEAGSLLAIREGLMKKGFVENEDFIWYGFLERKVAVVYGNCHMLILEKTLRTCDEFKRQYKSLYISVSALTDEKRKLLIYLASRCDLVIMQDIRQQNALKVPAVEDVMKVTKDICERIVVVNTFGCNIYFPQIKENRMPPNEESISYRVIGKGDENIERLYYQGKNAQEIYEDIIRDDFYSSEDVMQMFRLNIEKLRKREEKCDIIISDFIEKNYKTMKLFYEPFHCTKVVIAEKAQRILNRLNISAAIDMTDVRCRVDTLETFIYPSVKKILKITFKEEYMRNINDEMRWEGIREEPISLKEYVEDYCNILEIEEQMKERV